MIIPVNKQSYKIEDTSTRQKTKSTDSLINKTKPDREKEAIHGPSGPI